MTIAHPASLARKRRTRLALALALCLGSATAAPLPVALDATGGANRLPGRSGGHGDIRPPTTARGPTVNGKDSARSTAATIVVTNCNNSGSGSLRAAVAAANSDDTVDISGLACTIALGSTITVDVDSLTIKGNPGNPLAISGQNAVRPLRHDGIGTLALNGVSVRLGRVVETGANGVVGGCIWSQGTVSLANHSVVSNCLIEQVNPGNHGTYPALGGGVMALLGLAVTDSTISSNTARGHDHPAAGGGAWSGGDVTLMNARISGNTVESDSGIWSLGGGIQALGDIIAKYSTIEGNSVYNTGTPDRATGGGIRAAGYNNLIGGSTISGNTAGGGSALVLADNPGHALTSRIFASTIANNTTTHSSSNRGGAIWLGSSTSIENSTISGNIEKNPSETKYGAGITIADGVDVAMYSTVVSKNFLYAPSILSNVVSDIVGMGSTTAIVTGSHNMYGHKANVTLPGDSIQQYTPGLGPLADNGGLTRTMAVLPGSPLIDAGDDDGGSIHYDQRGPGFARVHGVAADIGAFESADDIIFVDGFD